MKPIYKTNNFFPFISRSLATVETAFLYLLFIGVSLIDQDKLMNSNRSEKFFFFYSILAILLFLKAIRISMSSPVTKLEITWLDILLVTYIIYITCSRFFVAGIFGNTLHYFEAIGLAIFYILIRTLKKETRYLLTVIVLIAGTVQAIYGNLQLYNIYPSHHSLFNITGGFFNPGPYAGYLASVFPVALGVYLFCGHISCKSFENVSVCFRWFHKSFNVVQWYQN